MNLVLDQAATLRAVTRVQGVIERRTTIPALSNVLLSAEGDQVRLTGTDMNIEASELLDCLGAGEGGTTIPAGRLHDILRLSDGGEIALTLDGPRARVKAGRSNFALPTLPQDGFPRMKTEDMTTRFELPAADLLRLLEPIFACATEDSAPLHGLHLHVVRVGQQYLLRTAATDRYRLARFDRLLPQEALPGFEGVTLTPKSVRAIQSLLAGAVGDAEVSLSDRLIRVECGAGSVTSKLRAGEYPDYGRVVPSEREHVAHVEGVALLRAVRRALIVTEDKTRSLRVEFAPGRLTVSARTLEAGEAADEIEAEYDGPEASLGFNGGYLADIVGMLEDRTVTIGFNDNRGPVLFTDDEDPETLLLLMPFAV